MTPKLFFTSTYDPTVNFPFDFLSFHSDALIYHLLFLHFILMHSFAICYFWAHHLSRPLLSPHDAVYIISKELILHDVLFGNPENISPNNSPDCAHLSYLIPTPTNNAVEGRRCFSDFYPLSLHPTSTTNTVHPQKLNHHAQHRTPPLNQIGVIRKTSTLENLVPVEVSFNCMSHSF